VPLQLGRDFPIASLPLYGTVLLKFCYETRTAILQIVYELSAMEITGERKRKEDQRPKQGSSQ
jgi:hypothetical protein